MLLLGFSRFGGKNKEIKHNCRKGSAFTLAEVLITLGIIGVVAAMTLPTLIQNYKKQEAGARLKKFYSTMYQAIKLSEIDNGPSVDWDKKAYTASEDGTNRAYILEFFNHYLKPYIKYVKLDENPDCNFFTDPDLSQYCSDIIKIYLADGSNFYAKNGGCTDIVFDINGDKKPNFAGKDMFKFLICPSGVTDEWSGNQNYTTWCPGCKTREDALKYCKNWGGSCARLLQYDNWEFKEDYPYKL